MHSTLVPISARTQVGSPEACSQHCRQCPRSVVVPDERPACAYSGAMDEVRPNFCSLRHIVLAICFHVVVTVAVPIEWHCTVMRCAFLRVIVLTTFTMAMLT